ncbi:MAG: heterodisulfide reductase [Candidatus Parabeggiatoa sp. nov. 1]|nr:MAG: heterodisulfide reductase [Gammaproteobacteria bacterium]
MSTASFERGYNAFKEQIDAPIAAYFSSCVRCGTCAEACLFFTETGDPKYTPIYKLEPLRKVWEQEYTLFGKLKSLLGLSKKLTDNELAEWQELIYGSCSMCGRCSMVCPVGNDLVYMIRKAREGMAAAGHAPPGIVAGTQRAITTGSATGVGLPTLQAQIRRTEREMGIKIPVDVQGTEYMALISAMEILNYPEYIGALSKIMARVGKTWTLSSEGFEATNAGVQIGVSEIAKELVMRIVNAAEKLQVKTVISPECGHAYNAIRWDGPNLVGRPFTFKVKHILELLDEWREQGLLKTEGFEQARMTFHDPCQLVRRGGVIKQPRNLLKMVATNFVEMEDHGKMNWCCAAGGGMGAQEEAEELRLKAFNRKKTQLDALKVDTLVTACANCRDYLEEGLEVYEIDMPVVGLTEMIADHLSE